MPSYGDRKPNILSSFFALNMWCCVGVPLIIIFLFFLPLGYMALGSSVAGLPPALIYVPALIMFILGSLWYCMGGGDSWVTAPLLVGLIATAIIASITVWYNWNALQPCIDPMGPPCDIADAILFNIILFISGCIALAFIISICQIFGYMSAYQRIEEYTIINNADYDYYGNQVEDS